MKDDELLARIVVNPAILVGKPIIKGTRLSVALILNLLGHGATVEEILDDYDWLERDDIYACLLFAHKCMEDITFMPLFSNESKTPLMKD